MIKQLFVYLDIVESLKGSQNKVDYLNVVLLQEVKRNPEV